jgi:hypothetical protein
MLRFFPREDDECDALMAEMGGVLLLLLCPPPKGAAEMLLLLLLGMA